MQCGLAAATGWTLSEVGELTLPRLRALSKAWKSVPPMPTLLAAFMGIKPEVEERIEKVDPAQQAEFDGWLAKQLDSIQANGGAVSNMVVQAQGE